MPKEVCCTLYYAIIGDIIDSRKASDRDALQKNLKQIISNLNQSLSTFLASPLVLTEGDSFQGLFQYSFPLVYLISEFRNELYPYKIRFGVGVGELATQLNPENSLENDGPAYHLARNAIEYVKKQKYTGFAVCIRTGQNKLDFILNAFCREMNVHAENWSSTQEKCVRASQITSTKTSGAELAGVELSSYSRILSRAHLPEYELSLSEFERYLFYEFDLNEAKEPLYEQYSDFLMKHFRYEDSLDILKEWEHVLSTNGITSINCLSGLAESYFKLDQPEKALHFCQKIVDLQDSLDESSKSNYYGNLANLAACHVRLHHHTSADSFLIQLLNIPDVIKNDTLYVSVLQNLKNSYIGQKKIEPALALCDQILKFCQDPSKEIDPSQRSPIMADALWNKVHYSTQPFDLEDILKYFDDPKQIIDSHVLHPIMKIIITWAQRSANDYPLQAARFCYLAWNAFVYIEKYNDALEAAEFFLTLWQKHSNTFLSDHSLDAEYEKISKWYRTIAKKKKGYSKKKKE